MKKLFALLITTAVYSSVTAQDIKTAETYFTNKEYDKAKTAIDNALNGNFNSDPRAWIWKHKIYQTVGKTASPAAATAILFSGFEALKKGISLPKGDEAAILVLGLNINEGFNNYYITFINNGSALMNAEDNSNALANFKNALAVSAYFYEKKLITTELDTMLTFYAGYTAMKADKINDAVYYFKKIGDAGAYGTDLQIAYGWLCNYYLTDKKDAATARLYCEKGLKFYASDEYLRSKKNEVERVSGNMNAFFNSYEDVIASGKATFTDYLSYGAELYDYLYVDNKATTDKAVRQTRLFEVLSKAYELKPGSAETNYILGMSHTSNALELDTELKKTTAPEAQKSKMKTERDASVQKSITHLEIATSLYGAKTSLAANDKNHYKTSLQQLVNLYKFTANKEKQAATEEKLKGL
ncbi:MAG: hypothetical protein JNM14_02525 [Ferruginibacter sp.]|nr:hypothetical protein [Ferruginibacter sp.]